MSIRLAAYVLPTGRRDEGEQRRVSDSGGLAPTLCAWVGVDRSAELERGTSSVFLADQLQICRSIQERKEFFLEHTGVSCTATGALAYGEFPDHLCDQETTAAVLGQIGNLANAGQSLHDWLPCAPRIRDELAQRRERILPAMRQRRSQRVVERCRLRQACFNRKRAAQG